MTGASQHPAALGRAQALALLEPAAHMVDSHMHPDGTYAGWSGREVLIHLAVYARLVGAVLRAEAERQATPVELFGRELSDDELQLDLDDQNAAAQREYAALDWQQALAFWRGMHAHVETQLARLTDAQLAAPGPAYPPTWARAHLSDSVVALCHHYRAHLAPEP